MVFILEIHQLFFLFFKTLIRGINFGLELSLKLICIRWMLRVDDKHQILNGSWWKLSQFIMMFLLELYQFFFLFFKTLIIWINLSLLFSLKVIFRRWMFRDESKKFILNGSWWKISQFIVVFFLELYKFFFLFFKTLIRRMKFSLGFSLKKIFRRWSFRGESKHLILNGSSWNMSQVIMVFLLELYQLFFLFVIFW